MMFRFAYPVLLSLLIVVIGWRFEYKLTLKASITRSHCPLHKICHIQCTRPPVKQSSASRQWGWHKILHAQRAKLPDVVG